MAHIDTLAVLVLTTVPTDFDAETLARRLLEDRLVACVSVLPAMRSIYRWQGAVETSDERQLLLKTHRDRIPALEAALKTAHPYEVPEFLVLSVSSGSAAYLEWIRDQSSGEPGAER
jgi:periplasmic divalent cation tolerance protein